MALNIVYKDMPTVALRGLVVFPEMRIHFEVGRQKSIAAIRAALANNQKIFLVTQKSVADEDPDENGLFSMGVVATVKQVIKSQDSDSIRVVIEGCTRASLINCNSDGEYLVSEIKERNSVLSRTAGKDYVDALVRKTKSLFEEFMELTSKHAQDVAMDVYLSKSPDHIADFIAGNALVSYEDKQAILEELNTVKRLEKLCNIITHEMTLFKLEDSIDRMVQEQMDQSQHEYYLREQLKAISSELGEGDDLRGEVEEYKEKIYSFGLEQEVEDKLIRECVKLSKMQSNSADANVIRAYLDACIALPWNKYTTDNLDIERAKKILDRDHFGMKKVKERFVEMLAVRALTDNARGQIICLVGPPGVGKTSIVKSVAEAMGRKYVRMSLGGVRDEAEIRGHRKTYIGSMPGRMISSLTQAVSFNPIILLDEIDKLGSDYKGDPSAALLEALDPEQNNTFRDHYIEFPIDLSKVLFITTANDSSTIPAPLYDRMEIIELSSYTSEEKHMIAKNHLIKKQIAMHGLSGNDIRFSKNAIDYLIEGYTREAGVRRLEQNISAICRKSAVKLASGEGKRISITPAVIEEMLGPRKFKDESHSKVDLVGVVNGLAWTSVGGEMLSAEALVMDGSGKLELTGSLGDVMKESAKAAHSYIRSIASKYGIDNKVFKNKDIHIHFPQGAVPKDGPSAGVTVSTAILSALTNRTVKQDVAMTGEISLTGRVMPIGGLREKTMAAYKNGIRLVIIPKDNESDLWEVEDVVKQNVEFVCVERLDEVFALALNGTESTKKVDAKRTSFKIENTKQKENNIAQ